MSAALEHPKDLWEVRAGIAAAAAVLGVQVDVVDGQEWSIDGDTVRVGIDYLHSAGFAQEPGALPVDQMVVRTLLLLWESAREARVAPARRSRRLALSRRSPHLEPLLAALDRLLAATELLAAMPAFRVPVAQVIGSDIPTHPAELPRHLQWVSYLLLAGVEPRAAARLSEVLAQDVQLEIGGLQALAPGHDVLRAALAVEAGQPPLYRFERAFGIVGPAYERLLAKDLASRGLSAEPPAGSAGDEVGAEAPDALPTGGGGDDAEAGAEEGGGADTAASDGENEQARAGDQAETAEGADLFAAEQAGFVRTVLATPLPADGEWATELPRDADSGTTPDPSGPAVERQGHSGATGARGSAETGLSDYVARATSMSAEIDALRELWHRVISERIGVRNALTRLPQAEGETLARDHLVAIIADATAGTDRPRAFLARHRRPKRVRRAGSTDYVLLIDRSASMQGATAAAAADAALIVLESLAAVQRDIAEEERTLGIDLELSLRTALIVFDSEPEVVKPLAGALDDAARRSMHAAVRQAGGSTNDAAALAAAARELGLGRRAAAGEARGTAIDAGVAAVERRRVVIFMSDGGTDDGGASATEIARLRAAGVTVFGVGLGSGELVRRFAPDGVRVDQPAALPAALSGLVASSGIRAGGR